MWICLFCHTGTNTHRTPVKIANEITTEALIDTGASISIISSELAKQINIPPTPAFQAPLRAANGSLLNFSGKINTDIELLLKTGRVKCGAELHICEGLPVKMLLGIDLLTKLGITIDCASQALIPPKFAHTNTNDKGACFLIAKTVLPPKMATMIEITAPKSKCNTIFLKTPPRMALTYQTVLYKPKNTRHLY